MSRTLAFKLGAIGLLILILMIPLVQISDLNIERQHRRDGVVQDIARHRRYADSADG